ncbi:MAG: cupin domain-containing protein [Betaproteobacteria bacterium]|nr:cupin domain-containing protein [Betaproteobacteria bacterium]
MQTNLITLEHGLSEARLMDLEVPRWPIWSKGVSTFPWTYDVPETCYFLEGEAVVTPRGGQPVRIAQGDLAIFPTGLSCTWDIKKPVRKHYHIG